MKILSHTCHKITPLQNLSTYWLADSAPDLNSLFDLLKLQHAVANFVKIVSGREVGEIEARNARQ